MPDWSIRTLEFGTLWCETNQGGTEIWLEWNPRVFAYRFGFCVRDFVAQSRVGYAESLEAALVLALRASAEEVNE